MAVLRFIYALYLRLTGLGLLAIGGAYFYLQSTDVPLQPVDVWIPTVLAAIGLLLLIPWWLPRGLRSPARGRDLVWMAIHAVIAVLYLMLEPALIAGLPSLVELPPEVALAAQDSVDPLWLILPPFTLLLLLVLPSMRRAAKKDSPDPDHPARAVPVQERKPVPLPEKKLPALGAAMKLYIVADWMILRVLGLGLMATAYMLWDMIETGRIYQAELLSHGKDPMTAIYVYGGVGALLGIPFLLPRRLARPTNVAYGLLKAILLVGAAYVLIEPLNVAIVAFTPDMYHATLIETVPRLFKAVCGVAVTAALLISFFRQLNGLPAVDYNGEAKITLTPAELHKLRKARMQS